MNNVDRIVTNAQRDLDAAVEDALADNPDGPVDDMTHDLAVEVARGIDNDRARAEFCRIEGIPNPRPMVQDRRDAARRNYQQRRQPLNDQTRDRAVHYGDEWQNHEDARVLTWDRSEAGLVALATELGRSTEAVRQRFHKLRREPRDTSPGTRQPVRRTRAAQRRTETPLGAPCPVCGLHHPGEC